MLMPAAIIACASGRYCFLLLCNRDYEIKDGSGVELYYN